MQRGGIALVMTLMFVILITVAIGVSLKQVNRTTSELKKESFTYRNTQILQDVLKMLQTSKDLDSVVKVDTREAFLGMIETPFPPFSISDMLISIELKQAYTKLNINVLNDSNGTVIMNREVALKQYFSKYMINQEYVDMILDATAPPKEYESYRTDIFTEQPTLFKEYIASFKHLSYINSYYENYYKENTLSKIDTKALFEFSKDRAMKVDANSATSELWEIILGCSKERAEQLSLESGAYETVDDLLLSPDEKKFFEDFDIIDFKFKPVVHVTLDVEDGVNNSIITFVYNLKSKKATNFLYN